MSLNEEKVKILEYSGDALVIANPGTGKTLLLAHKYISLVRSGVKPEEILCLTFTKKAKKEMEERIVRILKENKQEINYAHLNVYTFHSYALEAIGRDATIPSNLLRYSIYQYFKDNKVLNYADKYLIETIVPKMENLIRYLKSFGITPEQVNVEEVKSRLSDYKKLSKEEMDKFAECFIDVYAYYEDIKKDKGIDYADMLLEFMKLEDKPKFKYVLIDELQDVNTIEADLALQSGDNFFAVGDKKQAIFGFQGGSTVNFQKFMTAETFVLSENFRSTNAILDYAKDKLISKTLDSQHKADVEKLNNPRKQGGMKPVILDVDDEDVLNAVCVLASDISKQGKKVAIIARANLQIMRISRELDKRGIKHCSTYFSASDDARKQVITFLRGVLSNDVSEVKNSMFTPFFPIALQDAFELSEIRGLTLEKIFQKSPEYKKIRETTRTVEDVNALFNSKILPASMAYGKEYLIAALAIHQSFNETMSILEEKSFKDVLDYLKASDIPADESEVEEQIVLTTVHKAKGRQFQTVIYVPQKSRDKNNFQDEVVKAILKTKGIDAEEELGEEDLRINFVAFTRAEEELYIIPDKVEDYLSEKCEKKNFEATSVENFDRSERLKRAYVLFVNGEYEKSQKLLAETKKWIVDYVREYFNGIDSISYSYLEADPRDYLVQTILGIREYSPALDFGIQVHSIAESILKDKPCVSDEKTKSCEENVRKLLLEVKKQYPQCLVSEQRVVIPLEQLVGSGEGLKFVGKIDAVFKNGDTYLILDWKTDKNDERSSDHRQQLEAYRRAYARANNIPLEKIQVAIAYVALRTTVNLGRIECKLDSAQPAKTSFDTFSKKVNKILAWKNDPELFLKELEEKQYDENFVPLG
ncbi:MAG: ATP-dependent helicase [Leptospiraceae bacterium]|nr:ATP-dependent helicase [Leptospiraceae bacterium]